MEGMQYRFTYPALADFRSQARSYSDLIAFDLGHGGLDTGDKPEEFFFSLSSGNYFSALGIKPAVGRLFAPGEGEAPDNTSRPCAWVFVLAEAVRRRPQRYRQAGPPEWRPGHHRGGCGAAFPRYVREYRYAGLRAAELHDAYIPNGGRRDFFHDRTAARLTMMGMLKPGVRLAEAQSEAQVIASRLEHQYPATDKGISVAVLPETWARPAPIPSMVAMAPIRGRPVPWAWRISARDGVYERRQCSAGARRRSRA